MRKLVPHVSGECVFYTVLTARTKTLQQDGANYIWGVDEAEMQNERKTSYT